VDETERVRHRFDLHARKYDNSWTAWLGEQELKVIRKLAPPNSRVLDYGCGTGRTTLDLLRRSCQVTAFDISEQMLKQAQAKAQSKGLAAEFTCSSEQLSGRTWPVITCIGVTEYYPDPGWLLQKLRGYLEPLGILVVTFPNALSPMGWFYYLGSRFTVPARPRTPNSARLDCLRAGFIINQMLFALPAIPPIGYTMVLQLNLPPA
jgi:2-polyprenyl-3-methyl-5-hydroxy-6-metoxy-1,4-benzoquinol methylase